MKDIFVRSDKNPIIQIHDMPVNAEAVYNPGATEHDGTVVLLLRVEEADGFSSIFVARSRNGVDNWEIDPKALLHRGQPGWRYEEWGCEDPRITFLKDRNEWYITYTAFSPAGAAVGLAKTSDFQTAERIGLIFSPNNKDAALFPVQFHDRYAVLHRPDAGGGIENIWMGYSPDLIHWGEPHVVLLEGHGPAWDAVKVGAGPPPLETRDGWLLLYHGVKMYANSMVYRTGIAMLDRHNPNKVVARSPQSIFRGSALYEQSGLVPNVVFPTGMLLRGDELWIYYGAADFSICLAVAKLSDVLNCLNTHGDVVG